MIDNFEKRAGAAYRKYASVARRYHYTFARPAVTRHGVPVALFLGNHSSGKSTLINWLVGGDPVQDTGVAPTDDGFTVLTYGEREEDVVGPAALARLPEEFRGLETFGDTLRHRFRLKIRARESLRGRILVDSPGMIDSAEGTVSRTYDFAGAVKCFANLSDMVFFLLDPEKPGTTGETVTVFSRCLTGMEYKLWVVLNKCDTLISVNDFARVYGTACWNLARILCTKDLPKIWTIYSGTERESPSAGMSFLDFNRQRKELQALLADMAPRRADNVFASVCADFEALSMRMRLVNYAVSQAGRAASLCFAYAAVLAVVLGLSAYWGLLVRFGSAPLAAAAGVVSGLVVMGLGHLVARPLARKARLQVADEIDEAYERLYAPRVAIARHDDLAQRWAAIRDETVATIRRARLDLPWFAESVRARLDRQIAQFRGRS